VAHPHLLGGRLSPAEHHGAGSGDRQLGAPVLADAGVGDDATRELLGDELGAVADAQDRGPEVVDVRVDDRRPFDVDRLRTAGEDDPSRVASGDLGCRDRVRDDLAVDVCLADAPGDELGVLSAEVDDEDRSRLDEAATTGSELLMGAPA
jgi:hypothetical protein